MKNFRIIISFSFLINLFTGENATLIAQPKVGDTFPSWTDGYLDIHHINTGKGESALFILPDGTTLLVDAGATIRPKPRVTDPKPDGSRTPGDWISRYIIHMIKGIPSEKLDYILLTHFDDDHIGGLSSGIKTSASGRYKLTGVTEVGEIIPFTKVIDRGWPDYDFPKILEGEHVKNYIEFLKYKVARNGIVVEQFRPGANNQIVILNQPGKYQNFEFRNIAVNGRVWTGVGTNERNYFPLIKDLLPADYPGENMSSVAFRLSYGKFDYFNGGDLTTDESGSWRDIETPVGLVTGPVEICEVNHHAYFDAMGEQFIRALRPEVFIIQSWAPSHPSSVVLSRMQSKSLYPGNRDIYSTNIMDETKIVIGAGIDNLKSQQGHIVVRVNPGGNSFMIYILNDSDESFRIKAVSGPYVCN